MDKPEHIAKKIELALESGDRASMGLLLAQAARAGGVGHLLLPARLERAIWRLQDIGSRAVHFAADGRYDRAEETLKDALLLAQALGTDKARAEYKRADDDVVDMIETAQQVAALYQGEGTE